MKSFTRLCGAVFAVSLFMAAIAAAEPLRLAAGAQGQVVEVPGVEARAEVVTFGEALVPALLRVAPGETVRIAGWPVAPGVRAEVRITRFEIYAPEARIWKVEGERQTEVPRSRMAFFRGMAEDDPGTRVFVALEPDADAFQGLSISLQGTYEIRPYPEAARGRGHLVTVPEYFLPENVDREQAEPLSWTCGQSGAPLDFLQEEPARAPAGDAIDSLFESVISSLHSATIAVDTDNELMLQKFSNNTTNATNYVAALIAAMNVIYERDLNIRLLQGTTYLRVSTTADPYAQTGSGASVAQLNEFGTYWQNNYGGVSRALAMMLSGKGSSMYSSSGIAWLTGLCSGTYGYSFTQVFKFPGSTGATDAFVVGHELGHNFGSPHTHCYSPRIDTCYGAEPGCHSGATSCPAAVDINGVPGVTGTLMSYCHLLGGCDAFEVFHPTTVNLITGVIQPRINLCVFPVPTSPTIALVSPSVGSTAGGTTVTITGANFQNTATVKFGDTNATSVTFNSAVQLTATSPPHTAGTVAVTVTVPGNGYAIQDNAFTFSAPPVVSTVSLSSGSTAGGTTVTITGTGFQSGATVSFGGTPAASVTFNNSTQLTVTTPARSAGTVDVTVTNPNTLSGNKTNAFTFVPPPTISNVSPGSGLATGGASVTITGLNFQNGAAVSFGGTAAASVTFNSATQLTATTPAHPAGTVSVTVTNPDGQSETETNVFTFTPLPTISSLSPNSGPTAGGTSVTVTGANFQNGATATFGGSPVAVTFVNATQLTFTTPSHATGTVGLVVTNPDTGSGTKTNAFFYAPPTAATDFYTLDPCRLFDTRQVGGPTGGTALSAGAALVNTVQGSCGIPAEATAIMVNVTVVSPTGSGFLSINPGNAFFLGTATLTFQAGEILSNNATVSLATDGAGTIHVYNGSTGTAQVVLDVTGYYTE